MSNTRKTVLAFCLLGASLEGCSLYAPSTRDFTQVDQRPAKAQEAGNTPAQAEAACKEQTQQKGIASVTAIFARFRKGSADEDYVDCMKQRGFEVKQ